MIPRYPEVKHLVEFPGVLLREVVGRTSAVWVPGSYKSVLATAFERMVLEEPKCTNEKQHEKGSIALKEAKNVQPKILTEPIMKSTAE